MNVKFCQILSSAVTHTEHRAKQGSEYDTIRYDRRD